MNEKIDSFTFSQEMIKDIVDFVSFWKNNKNNPNFPEKMNREDWFEQFCFFSEDKNITEENK